ncbi:hypothetical protein [Candidatus Poriferisodalis sp.]|uniref:hypothetical protein n=1 Tax=Candidatus Poriferisodalis sp. TaxID=3101277 RepID=UPI003B01DE12
MTAAGDDTVLSGRVDCARVSGRFGAHVLDVRHRAYRLDGGPGTDSCARAHSETACE